MLHVADWHAACALPGMLKNYFRTAWRNLLRHKSIAVINLAGLSIGFTCCMLIALYLQHELRYEDFHQNRDRIARVLMEYQFGSEGQPTKGDYTSVRVGPVLQQNFPEVETTVRMSKWPQIVRQGDKVLNEQQFLFADSTFFQVFSFPLLQGNPKTALTGPNKIVLTESAAKKYFGSTNVLGKTLIVGTKAQPLEITGITADCPSNTQIRYDFLASFRTMNISPEGESTYWNANYNTYVLLKDAASFAPMQAKIDPFMKEESKHYGATIRLFLEPFRNIHLHSEYAAFEPNGSIMAVYVMGAVALLVLLIACFTYINLSTARSLERAREVGVRKVMGAGQHQLFGQFMTESAMLCAVAVGVSALLAAMLLPGFNNLTGKTLSLTSLLSVPFITASLGVALLVSLAAGSYPALILTGYQPVKVLKGAFQRTNSGQWVRKSLITFQFAISVFLIACTFIVRQQLKFIQEKKLGYDRDHILVLPLDNKMLEQFDALKQSLKSGPGVQEVSRCVRTPIEGGGGYNMRSAQMPADQQMNVTANPVDEDYIRASGMRLIAGESFSAQDVKNAEDTSIQDRYRFVLNESAAKQLGWTPEQAVGQRLWLDDSRPGYVKGVVADFHFESFRHSIQPFVLFPPEWSQKMIVKLDGNNMPKSISHIESVWKKMAPHRPFEYTFMDQDFNNLYDAEIRLGRSMDVFALVAVVLACLGLFGLSAYTVRQRFKEIGIRKVLGASAGSILLMLSGGFVRLSLVAICVGLPLAWWAAESWLKDFSYRTPVSWLVFAAAGGILIGLTMLTVGLQALKGLAANPVNSLRSE
ncbi:ABC transporter permease [Chitinophaga sp. NPDC101104]|uniref:ABC transporter permease n=1 Tax=Chitinophaga sp. NPDC101104 TaxID=3390561 RepID=UPI003CFDFA51